MRRWICSLLVVLIALSGMIQHGNMAGTDMHASHVAAMANEAVAAGVQDHDSKRQTAETGMADACAIICHGTPAPWVAVAQAEHVLTEKPLKWQFATVTLEGRGIEPGYRPPAFI